MPRFSRSLSLPAHCLHAGSWGSCRMGSSALSRGRAVTPRSRGRHAASSRAASRGQHPPHKGSVGSCQELRLRGFLRFFQPPLVLCGCVAVLATQPFAYLLFVTLTRLSLARFSSNPRESREPPCGVGASGWTKERLEGRGSPLT